MVERHPETIAQALDAMARSGFPVVAGGTDWMLGPPPRGEAIFLGRVAEMQAITATDVGVRLGAGCTFTRLLEDALTPAPLAAAMYDLASPAIRNMGTLGGNIVNASPAGDTLPILYALDAVMELRSSAGTRMLPIDAFILGNRRTALQPGELLTHVHLPRFDGLWHVEKVGARGALAISKCSLAALLRVEAGTVRDFRAAFGAVGATVMRSRAIEAALVGQPVQAARDSIPQVVAAYSDFLSPIDDARSTRAYRLTVCTNLLSAFLRASI